MVCGREIGRQSSSTLFPDGVATGNGNACSEDYRGRTAEFSSNIGYRTIITDIDIFVKSDIISTHTQALYEAVLQPEKRKCLHGGLCPSVHSTKRASPGRDGATGIGVAVTIPEITHLL